MIRSFGPSRNLRVHLVFAKFQIEIHCTLFLVDWCHHSIIPPCDLACIPGVHCDHQPEGHIMGVSHA